MMSEPDWLSGTWNLASAAAHAEAVSGRDIQVVRPLDQDSAIIRYVSIHYDCLMNQGCKQLGPVQSTN